MTMKHHALVTAAALSDRDLLARLRELAGGERAALVELLAHLAELDTRRSLFLAAGYGNLYAYCKGALLLSEDATYNRVEAARACRRFPVILDLLAEGSVSLTAIKMLGRHLTPENHAEALAAARGRTKPEIEALVARLAPRPDLVPMIRRLPARATDALPCLPVPVNASAEPAPPALAAGAETPSAPPARPPRIQESSPGRFAMQLTVGQETHDRFRRLQKLLARVCRGGDPEAVFDLACLVLEREVLKTKRAAVKRPGKPRKTTRSGTEPVRNAETRSIPAEVRRRVWARDGERCAFVGPGGVRCPETKYLELHHTIPWAICRTSTPETLSVRCRAHNQYEAQLVFGERAARPGSSKVVPSLKAGP
jgi:hypothetical protein